MRIVLLGQDGLHARSMLETLAPEHQVVGIVTPAARSAAASWQLRLRRAVARIRGRTFDALAAASGAWRFAASRENQGELADRVRRARADVLVIAGFPWLLGAELLHSAPLGALNAHAALLPRHRGILPLFWIYHADDRETGVTVHWVSERFDAGDILLQQAFPLPRGFPVERLNRENAARGARLMRDALAAVAGGRAPRQPQDEARATGAPWVRDGTPMVDFERWDAERVWHFLAGLFPRFVEPLTRPDGTTLRYRGVLGVERAAHGERPGSVGRAGDAWRLYCRDGWVLLASPQSRPTR